MQCDVTRCIFVYPINLNISRKNTVAKILPVSLSLQCNKKHSIKFRVVGTLNFQTLFILEYQKQRIAVFYSDFDVQISSKPMGFLFNQLYVNEKNGA